MHAHIGCSGWFYWHWRGIFYPDTKRTDSWFKHYTANFGTVELNAPFYKWPKPATVRSWVRHAPADFRYSVKVNREITHERRLVRTAKLVNEFCAIEQILGPKLGCFLFQFPPSYKFTRSRLRSILRQIAPLRELGHSGRGEAGTVAPRDPSAPLRFARDDSASRAVEFRHRSWWREAVFRAFAERGLIFCTVSAPRLPDDLIRTTETIYIRLHGRSRWYRHDYSDAELNDLANKIKDSGAREAWVYFDNDREGFAIKNARELRSRLSDLGICVS